jgi:hypothetical protein
MPKLTKKKRVPRCQREEPCHPYNSLFVYKNCASLDKETRVVDRVPFSDANKTCLEAES